MEIGDEMVGRAEGGANVNFFITINIEKQIMNV